MDDVGRALNCQMIQAGEADALRDLLNQQLDSAVEVQFRQTTTCERLKPQIPTSGG
jgi:hypothetical protein